MRSGFYCKCSDPVGYKAVLVGHANRHHVRGWQSLVVSMRRAKPCSRRDGCFLKLCCLEDCSPLGSARLYAVLNSVPMESLLQRLQPVWNLQILVFLYVLAVQYSEKGLCLRGG